VPCHATSIFPWFNCAPNAAARACCRNPTPRLSLTEYVPNRLPFLPFIFSTIYNQSVGKTSLLNQFSSGKFTGQYKATIGADFVTKECVVSDSFGQRHLVTLQIWDTAGQERFQSLGVAFYRGADAAMLVYDISDPVSLDHLDRWKSEFLNQVGGMSSLGGGVQFPFVVAGNKADKEANRRIPRQRAEEWCHRATSQQGGDHSSSYGAYSFPLPHFDTSAKTSSGVEDAFQELARLALQYEDYKRRSQPQLFVPPTNTEPIDLRRQASSTISNDSGQGCC
jgi:Ras-related protein Rab-7A